MSTDKRVEEIVEALKDWGWETDGARGAFRHDQMEQIRIALTQHHQDLMSEVVEELDRLGNFWTNNGTWKVPTDQEMADDSFKALKFGKVELLADLKKFITAKYPTEAQTIIKSK